MKGPFPDRADRTQCWPTEGACQSYAPGHAMHFIHANHLARDSHGWRDGVVTAMHPGWIDIDYICEEGSVSTWYHQDLSTELQVGSPIRVHERLHAIGMTSGWVNVSIRGGSVRSRRWIEIWLTTISARASFLLFQAEPYQSIISPNPTDGIRR